MKIILCLGNVLTSREQDASSSQDSSAFSKHRIEIANMMKHLPCIDDVD